MSARAGLPIVDNKGRRTTLGPVLKQRNKLFSVVASHAVAKNTSLKIAGTSTEIGTVEPGVLQSSKLEERNVGFAIRTFALKDDILIDLNGEKFERINDPSDYLGLKVFKYSSSGVTEGVLSAVESPFHMRVGTSDVVIRYTGALEISSAMNFAKEGDAGAPIYTEDGSVVGILIGTADGRYYGAPATWLQERHNLELALSSDLLKHNARIAREHSQVKSRQQAQTARQQPLRLGQKDVRAGQGVVRYGLLGRTVADVTHYKVVDVTPPTRVIVQRAERLRWDHVLRLDLEGTKLSQKRGFALFPIQTPTAPQLDPPDLRADELLERFADVASVLSRGDDDGIYSAKTNYVVGVEKLLALPSASYANILAGLETVWGRIDPDAKEPMSRCHNYISTSAFHRLQNGKPISFASAWLLLGGLHEAVKSEGISWRGISVDPAIFYAEADAARLVHELRDRSLAREFETALQEIEPQFKHVSVTRLLEEASQGQPVRHATASLITEVARTVRNWGMVWSEAFRGDAQPVTAENTLVRAQGVRAAKSSYRFKRRRNF